MRATLTILGVAALILSVHLLTAARDEEALRAPGLAREREQQSAEAARLARSADSADSALPTASALPSGGQVFPVDDLQSAALARGVVGEATLAMFDRLRGSSVPPLDRSYAEEHIARVLNLWLQDPDRLAEDAVFLVRAWRECEDPAFRWALSFLLQRVPEDQFVQPLLELADVDPLRMLEAIASIGTDHALSALGEAANIRDFGPKTPEVRARIATRIAQSAWPEATRWLLDVGQDVARPAGERLAAVTGLSAHLDRPAVRDFALGLALGPRQVVLGDLVGLEVDHPDRDLRSAAVAALFLGGDSAATRQIVTAATGADGDPALASMVDRHLVAYQGPDLCLWLMDRAETTGRATRGMAAYLDRHATKDWIPRIQALRALAADGETRALLDAAALNAARR